MRTYYCFHTFFICGQISVGESNSILKCESKSDMSRKIMLTPLLMSAALVQLAAITELLDCWISLILIWR